MDKDQIISEQRDQLMQLRSKLQSGDLKPTKLALQDVLGKFECKSDGTTIGLKISPVMRQRLMEQKARFGAKSYRQVVQACIELGLRALEGAKDDKQSPVEKVSDVQRTDDQGDSPVRATAN